MAELLDRNPLGGAGIDLTPWLLALMVRMLLEQLPASANKTKATNILNQLIPYLSGSGGTT